MAILFDDASTEYLNYAGAVLTSPPITMATWFYSDSTSAYQTPIGIVKTTGSDQAYLLQARGGDAGDPLWAFAYNGANQAKGITSTGYSANTWHHGCAVFATTTDTRCFIDGGSKGTSSTSAAPADLNATDIGRFGRNSPTNYMSGRIAEAAIWNIALSDGEVALLAKGYSPLFFRPQNLVAYWPLISLSDIQDRVGDANMTAYNTPVTAVHPPKIIYPAPQFISYPVSAPGGYTITAEAGAYALTGQACGLIKASKIVLEAGSYALTGAAVSLEYNRIFGVESGAYTLTGQAANLEYGRKLSAEAGSHTLTGQNIGLYWDKLISVASGTYILTGIDVTLAYSGGFPTIDAEAGAYTVTGQGVNLEYSGNIDTQRRRRIDGALLIYRY